MEIRSDPITVSGCNACVAGCLHCNDISPIAIDLGQEKMDPVIFWPKPAIFEREAEGFIGLA